MYEIIDSSEFYEITKNNKYVLVDFSAKWCGPCKKLQPQLDTLSKNYPNALFVKVDVDNNPELAELHQISAMPTIMFYIDNTLRNESVQGADINSISSYCKKLFI